MLLVSRDCLDGGICGLGQGMAVRMERTDGSRIVFHLKF